MDVRSSLKTINLNLFQVLAAFYRHSTANNVAADLGVSSSAVSHSLREIRKQFGDTMFVRTPEGFVPTPRALLMQPFVEQAMEALTEAIRSPSIFEPMTSEASWTIGIVNDISTTLLPQLVRRFQRVAPRMSLDFRWRSDSPTVLIEERRYDLVIQLQQKLPSWAERCSLFQSEMVCIAHPSQFPENHCITLNEYCQAPHVKVSLEGFGASSIEKLLAGQKRERRIVAYSADFLTAMEIVAQSRCIATVPSFLAQTYAQRGLVRIFDSPLGPAEFQLDLVWHRGRMHTGLKWLIDQILDEIKSEA